MSGVHTVHYTLHTEHGRSATTDPRTGGHRYAGGSSKYAMAIFIRVNQYQEENGLPLRARRR